MDEINFYESEADKSRFVTHEIYIYEDKTDKIKNITDT